MCIPSAAAGVEGGGGWRAGKQSLTCWVPMLHIAEGTSISSNTLTAEADDGTDHGVQHLMI